MAGVDDDLLDTTDPWLLAGLFYLGSGLGLGGLRVILLLIGRAPRDAPLRRRDVPWLTGAILTGGIVGPVFLMFGLAGGSASQAALLLNLEGVLTAALAWLLFLITLAITGVLFWSARYWVYYAGESSSS